MFWWSSSVAVFLISPILKEDRKLWICRDAKMVERSLNNQQRYLPNMHPKVITSAKTHVDSVLLKPPWRPSLTFTLTAKFVYDASL